MCPSETASIPVCPAAGEPTWVGPRSRVFLAQVALREDKSIGSLTERQRRAVASLLTRAVARAESSSP